MGIKIADNFVDAMWNQWVGDSTDLWEYREPSEALKFKLARQSGYAVTDYPLLAKYDFKVWEILNDFFVRTNFHTNNYAPPSAQMAYAVRYGTPRNLRAEPLTVRECDDVPVSNVLIRWDPPSDYPCGYLDGASGGIQRAGTRLRWYHIDRKLASDADWSAAVRWSIDIPTFQQAHKYPFLLDPTAEAGQSYQYRVCTQDASTGITNLSEYSPTLDVTYPAAYAGFYDS